LEVKRRIEIDVRLTIRDAHPDNWDIVTIIPRTKDSSQRKIRLWFDYSLKFTQDNHL
jgi:hypothetical protein